MAQRTTTWGIGSDTKRITIQQAQTLLNRIASWLSYKTGGPISARVEMEYPGDRKYPIYQVWGPPPVDRHDERLMLTYLKQEENGKGRLLLSTQNTHTLYAFALGVAWAHDVLAQRERQGFTPMDITLDEPEPEPEPEPAKSEVSPFLQVLDELYNQMRRLKEGGNG